jgi:Na+/H+ antiporter NhaD/arsenite permease-like protein
LFFVYLKLDKGLIFRYKKVAVGNEMDRNKIMYMGWDSVFFLIYGMFSLIMGILNKGGLRWMSKYASAQFDYKYKRSINIVMGIISIAIGIALHKK